MTLDEAIKYYEEAANNCEDGASHCNSTDYTERHIASIEGESANKYRQLAAWLKELKVYRDDRDDCDYETLKIKLENAEDVIRGLQEDLRDAREELRWR